MRALPVLLAALLAFLTSACAEIHTVQISSEPEGATIYINGEERGVTPDTVRLPFAGDEYQRVIIQLVKDRYKPVFQTWTVAEIPQSKKFPLESE